MEWLNFRHLYAYRAVCQHGGFRKAAERLHVSQSTISEQVARLESYLGQTLLDRNTRSMRPTERGAALLEYADRIFAHSKDINRIFRDRDESPPTNIRVGMVGGISRNFVFSRVVRSLASGEQARIEVVDGSIDELTELMRAFEVDLIFSLDRPRQQDLFTVSYQLVASSPLCVAAVPERLRDLGADGPTELYLFRHALEESRLRDLLKRRFGLDAEVAVWTDDISLLRFLANGGRGLSLLPRIGVQEDLASGRVDCVILDELPQVGIYAIYPAKGIRRGLIERFVG